MKITEMNKDFIQLDETNFKDFVSMPKIHLIKLALKEPTEEKIKNIVQMYENTNRYVISDNIKIYNDVFKNINKKFYVENRVGDQMISFFRKNNKIFLNTVVLKDEEKEFLVKYYLDDILKNIEVIAVEEKIFTQYSDTFSRWRGNVIIL